MDKQLENDNSKKVNTDDIDLDDNLNDLDDDDLNDLDDNLNDGKVEDDPSLEDFQELQKKFKELEDKNKQLYARIKKSNKEPKKDNQTEGLTEINEEQLLKLSKVASNLDDDDIEMLKTITGSSIAEKIDNPLFKAYKAEKKRKERSSKASLSPSVSGTAVKKVSFNDPDLTAEEHRKLWEQTR